MGCCCCHPTTWICTDVREDPDIRMYADTYRPGSWNFHCSPFGILYVKGEYLYLEVEPEYCICRCRTKSWKLSEINAVEVVDNGYATITREEFYYHFDDPHIVHEEVPNAPDLIIVPSSGRNMKVKLTERLSLSAARTYAQNLQQLCQDTSDSARETGP